MSSNGQIGGAIIGGFVGFFAGGGPIGAIQGASIGSSIGGYIDPPPGPNLRGPTLDDKSFQSSAYGVSLARIYGRIAVMGNIIYLQDNQYQSKENTTETGGKGGGGGSSYTSTTYFANFAVALGEAMPGTQPIRIWAGGKLIYASPTLGVEALQQATNKVRFFYYDGTQTDPDSEMEADLGVGNCPSYEGTAYIIFRNFDLTEYGNGLAGCPIKVEIAEVVDEEFDIGSLAVAITKDYITPSSFDPHPACANPFEEPKGALISVTSTSKTNQKRYFLISEGMGVAAEHEKIIYRNIPVHSERGIYYAHLFSYYENNQLREGVYTSSGTYETKFTDYPEWYSATYATLDKIYSIAGEQWGFFYATVDTPEGVPAEAEFLAPLGTNNVAVIFDKRDLGVVAISGGIVYRVTKPYSEFAGQRFFKTYSLATGSELSSHAISLPYGTGGFNIESASIYKNNMYFFSLVPGTLQLTVINIGTREVTGREFVVNTTDINDTPQSSNISVGPGYIAVSAGIFKFQIPSYKAGIRVYFLAIPADDDDEVYVTVPAPEKLVSEICANEFALAGVAPEFYDFSEIEDYKTIGYKVSELTSARAALDPLKSAFLFDFVERGYKIHAVVRGQESVAVIPREHFMSVGDSGAAIKTSMDTGVLMPSKMSINYIDYLREFDTNTQSAEFPAAFINAVSRDLPVVMSGYDAAKLADIFISSAWTERKKYTFKLPQAYLGLSVSDVVTGEVLPGKFADVRIDNITKNTDQTIDVQGSQTSAITYTSTNAGTNGAAPPTQTIPAYTTPKPFILDIPMIRPEQDYFGVVAAASQIAPFTGSVLMLSADTGNSFSEIGRFAGPGVIGQCLESVLGEHDCFVAQTDAELLIDNIICGEFYSVTVAEMMAGKNYVAYGRPGRWEIMCYAFAVPTVDGGVTLSHFLRGMFGTEQYTGTHTDIDFVVLLDSPRNIFAPLPLQSVGFSWPILAVNAGYTTDTGLLADPDAYNAINLKPLSVVNLRFEKVVNDWRIDFDSRTRYQTNKWVTGANENTDTISYEVDVIRAGAVVRTITSTTKPINYTAAEQTADFGSLQSALTVDIYQINQRVGRGYAMRATT